MGLEQHRKLQLASSYLDVPFVGRTVVRLQPAEPYATSVLLHAANTMLLFLLLRTMTGVCWRSFVVAALFGVHPLRVESVAWVSERKDVLSTMFWMLTVWAYVRYADGVRTPRGGVQSAQR